MYIDMCRVSNIHAYIYTQLYSNMCIYNYIYICTHIIHEPLPTMTRITSGNLDVERTQLETCFLQWLWLKDANQNQWLLKMTSHSWVHTAVTWAIAKLSLHSPKNTVCIIYICIYRMCLTFLMVVWGWFPLDSPIGKVWRIQHSGVAVRSDP